MRSYTSLREAASLPWELTGSWLSQGSSRACSAPGHVNLGLQSMSLCCCWHSTCQRCHPWDGRRYGCSNHHPTSSSLAAELPCRAVLVLSLIKKSDTLASCARRPSTVHTPLKWRAVRTAGPPQAHEYTHASSHAEFGLCVQE